MRTVTFHAEAFTDQWAAEAAPLLHAHWREIAHFQDIPLDPDWSAYHHVAAAGGLRLYTARDKTSRALVGYAAFFVRPHPHYRGAIYAAQDVIWLAPVCRGMIGWRFLKWCDAQLQADGVTVVTQHVKAAHDFGPMLERMGYEKMDIIYARRLDIARAVAAATTPAAEVAQ